MGPVVRRAIAADKKVSHRLRPRCLPVSPVEGSPTWLSLRWTVLAAANGLKLEGIAKSKEVIDGRRRQAEANMKVELLVGPDLKSGSQVQYVLWPSMLRKFSRVLEEGVPSTGDLSV